MKTTYVLDTSVLINNPSAYKLFPNSNIIIPIAVLNELDNLKKLPNEAGRHARVSIKLLDEISERGDISTGILLEDDILIKVDANYYDADNPQVAGFGKASYGDTQILICAYMNSLGLPDKDLVLVSNDINLRVKAKSRGIEAQACKDNNVSISDLYSGLQHINNEDAGMELQQNGVIDPKKYDLQLYPHQCVMFQNEFGDGIAMARQHNHDQIKLIKKTIPWGIHSRNEEQSFAIDLLMDKKVPLVTFTGKAGCGKSLIALAAGLELVCNRKDYDKLVIYRPIQPVGNDIGYIPGTMEEKLAPWFQAIMDNLEVLLSVKNGDHWHKELDMFQRKGKIEMDAMTYIRGRSIPNAIILIDEAQNISKENIKTILTRAGENTKVVLTGDLEQIDNSALDATDNGLTYVIEKFKNSDLAGHITFTKGERSKLATVASEIL